VKFSYNIILFKEKFKFKKICEIFLQFYLRKKFKFEKFVKFLTILFYFRKKIKFKKIVKFSYNFILFKD
jgi:hypothetical protein